MRRCLIVVDYQQEFVTGRRGFPGAKGIDRAIAGKILACRAAGDDVLFTLDAAGGPRLYGTVGACLMATDRVFRKGDYGCNALYTHLRRTAYRSIEVSGVVSSVCVLVNAVLARTAQPGTPVLVDTGCIADPDAEAQDAALRLMAGLNMHILDNGVERQPPQLP
ncbi:MAG: isochorismatase family protein [Aristaeellaceae bacterium]